MISICGIQIKKSKILRYKWLEQLNKNKVYTMFARFQTVFSG